MVRGFTSITEDHVGFIMQTSTLGAGVAINTFLFYSYCTSVSMAMKAVRKLFGLLLGWFLSSFSSIYCACSSWQFDPVSILKDDTFPLVMLSCIYLIDLVWRKLF